MTKLAIVTDGSLRVPIEGVVQAVVPFQVLHQKYQNGIFESVVLDTSKVTQEEFLDLQANSKHHPTTSQPSPGTFDDTFVDLIDQGYDQILVLTVDKDESGTFNSAVLGKSLLPHHIDGRTAEIEIFDTGTTAAGIEYLASFARKLAEEDKSLTEIVEALTEESFKIKLFLVLDSIGYISARMPELSLKNLKGTLGEFSKVLASKVVNLVHRSPKVLIRYYLGEKKTLAFSPRFFTSMVDRLVGEVKESQESGKFKKIYLYQLNSLTESASALERLRGFTDCEIIEREDIPIALLAYTGPKLVGAVCIYE